MCCLTPTELLIASEYYGFYGYPMRLDGVVSLVGRVATPAEGRRPKPASRSTVAALLASATAKIEAQLPEELRASSPSGPEPDPAGREWVLRPPALGRKLRGDELRAVHLAGYEMSFDLVCRAHNAPELYSVLHRWGRNHLGIESAVTSGVKVRQEHRNASNAMLAISLWQIAHSKELLAQALRGDPVVGWPGIDRPGMVGRIAAHSTWGNISSDLTADDFVLLVDDVLEHRDDDGRAADLILDCIRSGKHRELLSPDEQDTVLWALGHGLAADGSWKLIELARLYARGQPRSLTTVSLMAWAAHVASLLYHDALAWRLCSGAERILNRLLGVSDEHRSGAVWQIELVRSGCRVREADRWLETKFIGNAKRAVSDAVLHLRRAEAASAAFPGSAALSRGLTNDLRRVEVLLVSHLLVRRGVALDGVDDPLGVAQTMLPRMRRALDRANKDEIDDGDRQVFDDRLVLLEAAALDLASDFLDDSAPHLPR